MSRRTTVPSKADDLSRLGELATEIAKTQNRLDSLREERLSIVVRRDAAGDTKHVELAEACKMGKANVHQWLKAAKAKS